MAPAAPSQAEAPADNPEAAPEVALDPGAAVATGEPQMTANAPADAAPQAKEPEFEEIWRPRRHARGEHRKDAGARPRRRSGREDAAGQSSGPAPAAAAEPAQSHGGNGHDIRPTAAREAQAEARGERSKEAAERGRDSRARRSKGPERRRREERRKPEVHSAAPPRRVGIEADSPFAALGALRDALVKRAKESGS
jgi:ATP-dependent RNA helicase SUPV3L1/SUV3